MHSDADFLAAVAANPHDQLTRLVYADWLDERDDPRGELVRIEEEVRFEPAWSEVLWSQKPRRNELRAMCDPVWLTAMRYGTDCLPLFYGRPFPDHWRDGWRLIREATERWLGVPMPDIGGHADEIAAVEARLGLTLPPSVREFVAFVYDWKAAGVERHHVLLDLDTMGMVAGQPALATSFRDGTRISGAVRLSDFHLDNPPAYSFGRLPYEATYTELDSPSWRSLTRQVFHHSYIIYAHQRTEFWVWPSQKETFEQTRIKLTGAFGNGVALDWLELFETTNLTVGLRITPQVGGAELNVKVIRLLSRAEIPAVLWEYVAGEMSPVGIMLEEHLLQNLRPDNS